MAFARAPNLRRLQQQKDENKPVYNGVVTRKRAALKEADNVQENKLNKIKVENISKVDDTSEIPNERVIELDHLINFPLTWPKCIELNNKESTISLFKALKERRNIIREHYSKSIISDAPIWFPITIKDEFMHAEYLPSIIDYLMEKEEYYEPLGVDYLAQSCDINYRTRYNFVDWMVQIHQKLQLSNECLQLSIAMSDRFIKAMKHQIKRVDLLIIGAMCMYIAMKLEEIYTETLPDFLEKVNVEYDIEKCCKLEENILSTLEFKLSIPMPLAFLRHYNSMLRADTYSNLCSRYFCELSLQDYYASGHSYNMIGASCVILAQVISLEKTENFPEVWTPALQCSSGLLYTDLADLIRNLCLIVSKQQIASKYRAIAMKYSSTSYKSVAETVVRTTGFRSMLEYWQSRAKKD